MAGSSPAIEKQSMASKVLTAGGNWAFFADFWFREAEPEKPLAAAPHPPIRLRCATPDGPRRVAPSPVHRFAMSTLSHKGRGLRPKFKRPSSPR